MKTKPLRKWVVALALYAAGGAAFGGDYSVGAAPPTSAARPSTLASDVVDPTLTISVLAPTGAWYRLAYAVGQGWRFVERNPDELLLASNGDVAPSPAPASSEEQPQSVFVDGPTGYVFVWNAEHNWRFLGRIAGAAR